MGTRQRKVRYAEEGHSHGGGGGGGSLPSTAGASSGDVLTLDPSLDPEWAPPAGGGGGVVNLDDLSDVTISSPTAGDVLTFDGSVWVPTAPAGGGGGFPWQGAWDSGTSYLEGQLVTEANGLYLALADSIGSLPGASSPATVPCGSASSNNSTYVGLSATVQVGQPFTVDTTLDVGGLAAIAKNYTTYTGTTLSIWSDSGGSPGVVLASGVTLADVTTGNTYSATFSAPVTLSPGVTYWAVVDNTTGVTDHSSARLGSAMSSFSSHVASIPASGKYGVGGTGWASLGGLYMDFTLLEPGGSADWQLVVQGV